MSETSPWKREARVCLKHGSLLYPHSFQCVVCKTPQRIATRPGPANAMTAPVPMNICFRCFAGGGISRCCGFELD